MAALPKGTGKTGVDVAASAASNPFAAAADNEVCNCQGSFVSEVGNRNGSFLRESKSSISCLAS